MTQETLNPRAEAEERFRSANVRWLEAAVASGFLSDSAIRLRDQADDLGRELSAMEDTGEYPVVHLPEADTSEGAV